MAQAKGSSTFLITGLPLSSDIKDEDIILNLNAQNIKNVDFYKVPSLEIQGLDDAFDIADELKPLDIALSKLYRDMSLSMRELRKGGDGLAASVDFDKAVKNFRWISTKFCANSIAGLAKRFAGDYEIVSGQYANRKAAFGKLQDTYNEILASLSGNLCQMDISTVVHGKFLADPKSTDDEEDSFLSHVYVAVPHAEHAKLLKFFKEVDNICAESIEVYLKDKEFYLVRVLCLKTFKEEVEAKLKQGRFRVKSLKTVDEFGLQRVHNKQIMNEYGVDKNNFAIFLATNIPEVFDLLMHVKVARVYIETVLCFGFCKCSFLCFEVRDKESCQKCYKKLVKGWKYSKLIINPEIDDEFGNLLILEDPSIVKQ